MLGCSDQVISAISINHLHEYALTWNERLIIFVTVSFKSHTYTNTINHNSHFVKWLRSVPRFGKVFDNKHMRNWLVSERSSYMLYLVVSQGCKPFRATSRSNSDGGGRLIPCWMLRQIRDAISQSSTSGKSYLLWGNDCADKPEL